MSHLLAKAARALIFATLASVGLAGCCGGGAENKGPSFRAPTGEQTAEAPRAFLATGGQGVNYGRNVWHHPLLSLETVCDFLVIDRSGPGNNLQEFFYPGEGFTVAQS